MNPAWEDLAEDCGQPTKLQIPHFVRDDNPKNNENGKDAKPLQTKAISA